MAKLSALAEARSDVFHLARKTIVVRQGFNIRSDYGDLKPYAAAIRASGVKRALIGHKNEKDEFVVTEGHRSLTAFDMALKTIDEEIRLASIDGDKAKVKDLKAIKAANLTLIPVTSEKQGYTDKDRTFDMLTFNDGKPLTILEEATGYQRLMKDFQVSEAEILRVTGKSRTAFQNCMMLINEGAPAVIDAVRNGDVASSLAVELVRKVKDKAEQTRLVKEAIGRAKEIGRTSASAKYFDSTTRDQIAPSKKGGGKSQSSSGGGGGGGGSRAPLGAGPREDTAKKKITDAESETVKFPAKVKIEALITIGRINGGNYAVAVKMKYPGSKEMTGTDLDADGPSHTTKAAARLEGLQMVRDGLLAAERTDKAFAKKCLIDDATTAIEKLIKDATPAAPKAESGKSGSVPADTTKDHAGQESLVLDPADENAEPQTHIIALRDKLLADKRMAKKKGFPAFVCLNFIADYLGGGRYKPEQFEKFFTEFVITGKQ